MHNRYREKMRGATRRYMPQVICSDCYSRHCHCDVDEDGFFVPTTEERAEWYGYSQKWKEDEDE